MGVQSAGLHRGARKLPVWHDRAAAAEHIGSRTLSPVPDLATHACAQSADFHRGAGELAAALRPQHDYMLDAKQLEGTHYGEVACRDFRESVLAVMPHRRVGPLAPAGVSLDTSHNLYLASMMLEGNLLNSAAAGCPSCAVAEGHRAEGLYGMLGCSGRAARRWATAPRLRLLPCQATMRVSKGPLS